MSCSLATIQAAACTSGIGKEQSRIKLLQLIAQLTCEAAEGGGGPTEVAWGDITGTLSNQTDLQAALDARNPLWVRAQNTQSSVTGTTNETVLWSTTIPGGTFGTNGWAEIYFFVTSTNDASAKTIRLRLGGLAGTECTPSLAHASLATTATLRFFACRNSNTAKISSPTSFNTANPFASSSLGVLTYNVDTSVNQDFVITGQLADSTDTLSL